MSPVTTAVHSDNNLLRNILFIILFIPTLTIAGESEAIAFLKSKQYEKAAKEFETVAASGDTKSMITIGELHYSGKLGPIDYKKANSWWYQAYQAGNADALSNIGVLYRDGKGVEQDLEVAYNIFLIVHMKGLGGENTQVRNNRNLRKTIAKLNEEGISRALCDSEEYIYRYIDSNGVSVEPTRKKEVRLKDKDWWLEGEIPNYKCP